MFIGLAMTVQGKEKQASAYVGSPRSVPGPREGPTGWNPVITGDGRLHTKLFVADKSLNGVKGERDGKSR